MSTILTCHAGVPYGGPGRGIRINGEVGGAGHGGHGGGDSSLSSGNPYGLTDTDLYLGGSTGIEESLTAALTSLTWTCPYARETVFVINRYLAVMYGIAVRTN